MLSLHGSLLSDPFAVPPPTPAAYETALPQHSSTDANGRAAAPPGGFRVRFEDQEPSDESDDDEDLPDPRAMLPPSVGAESVGDGKNGEEKRKKKDKMERKRSKKDTASASESEGESATPKKKRRKTQDA